MSLFSRFVRYNRSKQPFTVTGRLLAVAAIFCLFTVVDPALAGLFCYLLSLVAIGFVVGLFYRPKLRAQCQPLSWVEKGEAFTISIALENVGRRAAYDLECKLAQNVDGLESKDAHGEVSHLAAGETVQLELPLLARQRGIHSLPAFHVSSLFPFSLFRFINDYRLFQTVAVSPRTESLEVRLGTPSQGTEKVEWAASQRAEQRHGALEYVGSREWRPGLPVRRWDFTSWARLGTPAVREFTQGSEWVAVVVVDARRVSTQGEDPQLERVLARVASVVRHCDDEGRQVIMATVTQRVEFCDGRYCVGQRDELMTRLAGIAGSSTQIDWKLAWQEVRGGAPRDATFIAVLGRTNDAALDAISLLREQVAGLQEHVV